MVLEYLGGVKTAWDLYKAIAGFEKADKVVDSKWIEMAKRDGLIPDDVMLKKPSNVEAKLFDGSAELVTIKDIKAKKVYRIVIHNSAQNIDLVLMEPSRVG